MSEPKAVAERVTEVVPGLWAWSVADDRIGGYQSTAYALAAPEETVLIDPLPLAAGPARQLGEVTAIVLTSGGHERSAWRLRRELGVPVHAPAPAKQIEEEPDVRYGDGDVLPGGLTAVFTPGAGTTQHALVTGGEPAIAFVSDLLVNVPESGGLALTPAEFVYDADEQRRSVERLLELPFTVLCPAHGEPIAADAHAAIRAALDA